MTTTPDLAFVAVGDNDWMMRIGRPDAAPILFIPPLFEEMNRLRALIAGIMRALAAAGHGCWLPDLPGTGESRRPLGEIDWNDWRHFLRESGRMAQEASGRTPLTVAFRGGCLLDDAVDTAARWRFAPVDGAALVRDLDRAALAGGAKWAGYAAGEQLRPALLTAQPAALPAPTLRLETDRGEADRKVAGPALWRRSEPATDNELMSTIISDLTAFARQCAI